MLWQQVLHGYGSNSECSFSQAMLDLSVAKAPDGIALRVYTTRERFHLLKKNSGFAKGCARGMVLA